MARAVAAPATAGLPARGWTSVAGVWAGIGTSPGAILLGAGLAMRYGGRIPLLSAALGLALIATVVWVQGYLGVRPPWGEGADLSEISRRYFTPAMQRVLGALIAAGMTGWFGVNVGMGASALGALADLPRWATAFLIGVPIFLLSLRSGGSWNRLAMVTTACVLVLVALVIGRYATGSLPFAARPAAPMDTIADMAVLLGYVGVFSVRAPDFTARIASRRDLSAAVLLLIVPLAIALFTGAAIAQSSGSADVWDVLASQGGLAAGNLLVTLAVVAPTFTTIYSGAPALRAAAGLGQTASVAAVAGIGLGLAVGNFDHLLLPWLSVLGAMLPPVVVPLVTEFVLRRRGLRPRAIPVWPWLTGAAIAFVLALLHHRLAMVAGFLGAGVATITWRRWADRGLARTSGNRAN